MGLANLIGWGALCIILLVFLAKVKKAGSDEVRADANEKALSDVTKANGPADVIDIQRVRSKYGRD